MERAQNPNPEPLQEAPVSEDVNVLAAAEEILKFFKKSSLIIWFDIDAVSREQTEPVKKLQAICEVKVLGTLQGIIDLVQTTKSYCTIITSEANGEELVQNIVDKENIGSIFVLLENNNAQGQWVGKYKKKKIQIAVGLADLGVKVGKNIQGWSKTKSSLRQDLPIFSPIFNDDDTTAHNYLKINLIGLSQFENREQSKKDFLDLAKILYTDKKNQEDFANNYHDYDMKKIIKWYTDESFVYKMTNNCLRIAKADTIYYSRLVLKDLERAIKEIYQQKSKDFSGLLYRGCYISQEEWAQLEQNCGKDIEFFGFMSASTDKGIAVGYVQEDMQKKVFITIIVPTAPDGEGQGFAEIEDYSVYKAEAEVVFNIRSRFNVLETTIIKDNGAEYRHLVLLYGAQQIKKHLLMEDPTIEVKINMKDLKCHKCKVVQDKSFMFANISDPVQKICFRCIESIRDRTEIPALVSLSTTTNDNNDTQDLKVEGKLMGWKEKDLPFYGYSCRNCKDCNKGQFICQRCPESKGRLCKLCFEKNTDCVDQGHLVVFENHPYAFWFEKMSEIEYIQLGIKYTIRNQGDALYHTNQLTKAQEYFEKSLEQNAKKGDDVISIIHVKLGQIYEELGQLKKAMQHYRTALRLEKKVYGDIHVEIANSYSMIGSLYHSQGEFENGKGFHMRALKIHTLLQGKASPEVGSCYQQLGVDYYELSQYKQAKHFYEKALEIIQPLYGTNQPRTAIIYNNLGLLYEKVGEFTKAEKYYLKSLEVNKFIYGAKHPFTASVYNNLGLLYTTTAQFAKAEDCHKKALEIKTPVFGNENTKTATSKISLGSTYFMSGQYEKALEFYLDALQSIKAVYGENHPSTATGFHNVGKAYQGLGKFTEAEKYERKALELTIAVRGKDHTETGICYTNLGSTYYKLNKLKQAQECFEKGIKILKSVYGYNHPDLGPGYNGLGLVCEGLRDFRKANEHFKRALVINKAAYGMNHPETALVYSNIGCACYYLKEYRAAKRYLLKALEIYKGLYGENPSQAAECYDKLGLICSEFGEFEEAVHYHLCAARKLESKYGLNHVETASAYYNLGLAYLYAKEFVKAKETFSVAFDIKRKILGDDHSDLGDAYHFLGYEYFKGRQLEAARDCCSKCLKIFQSVYGKHHRDTIRAYISLGSIYNGLGQNEKGDEYHAIAIKLLRDTEDK